VTLTREARDLADRYAGRGDLETSDLLLNLALEVDRWKDAANVLGSALIVVKRCHGRDCWRCSAQADGALAAVQGRDW